MGVPNPRQIRALNLTEGSLSLGTSCLSLISLKLQVTEASPLLCRTVNLTLGKDASSEVWSSGINDKMVGQRKLLTLLPIKSKNLHMAKGY